ncbi:MAG: HAD-IC family P-type ATPase, partial [Clostridia bacterium]|nr:HAD-IC family P-type ATPase [Clostridia bacterium]
MQKEAGEQKCRVIRNGAERIVSVGEVVVGDLIRLRAGERIPADGRLIEGIISCDLSALNGESAEQKKYADENWSGVDGKGTDGGVRGENSLGERSSLFRGSEITSGEGVMMVTAVGDNTYYGGMAMELQIASVDSPLKIKLTKLADTLSKFGYCCAFAVGISGFLFSTVFAPEFVFSFSAVFHAFVKSLTLAVSVVVMAVPEGLPMMITVVLASNMLKMRREKVLVRKPVGIETAGSINILFTDKTGTLTYGKPHVSGYFSADSEYRSAEELSGEVGRLIGWTTAYACGGSEPVSVTDEAVEKVTGERKTGGKRGRSRRLYNKTVYNKNEEKLQNGEGDAADIAMRAAFPSLSEAGKGAVRVAYLPFNSTEKLCAAAIAVNCAEAVLRYGKTLTLIKGAPETVVSRCEYEYGADGAVRKTDRSALELRMRKLASDGSRVLAVAVSECGAEVVRGAAERAAVGERISSDELFKNATFVSFVCLKDNLRAEAADAIAELHGAGIQTVMITGDSPFTAEAIAREVGILSVGSSVYGEILTGSDVSAMSDQRLAELMPRLRVVARALPQDKSRLVRVASSLGMVVGMTGDGLNDAPALKLADVGFAMGSGTEIAKEAGDVVITDNNISSIVKAVHFGRTIFKSIRKFIIFQLTMNLCAVGISAILLTLKLLAPPCTFLNVNVCQPFLRVSAS